ncbi:MAG: serine/threonine protein kinase [Erysipelotrichaceae bacterium]|nr:serine/threonine protein kinase [Erysipelotrichaceae bacterium]
MSDQIDSKYEIIRPFRKSDNVFLVRRKQDGILCVLKYQQYYSRSVYNYLKDHHIRNTPVIYEIMIDGDRIVTVEEYIHGITLSDYINMSGRLSEKESINLIIKLCAIVSDLHNCDPPIIHRDIKPENIMISSDGDLILLDMNTAKFFERSESEDTYLLGTHGFASPEQYGFGKAGIASDIYGIGKVLNVMLTTSLNEKVPGHLGYVINKCTQIDPENRYQSVEELLKDLNGSIGSRSIDYNKLPGFRNSNLFWQILGVCGYGLSVFAFANANFVGVESDTLTWYYRVTYYMTFMTAFLFCRNYRYIWDTVGVSRIRNKPVRWLMITLIAIGLIVLGFLLTSIIMTVLGIK